MTRLKVGISRDFLKPDGSLGLVPEARAVLDEANVDLEVLEAPALSPISDEDGRRYDALIIKKNPVTAETFGGGGQHRLRLIARNGVGYDHIDVAACTKAGVMVTITPEAVRRPVASAAMALILAFAHRLFPRDRLTRTGRWSERWDHQGLALTGRTLGVVGLGNIGLEVLRLAAPWEMTALGHTAHPKAGGYDGLDVEVTSLESLLERSDFVVLACALTEQTHGMIDAAALARMKPDAYLINMARGEVVDEAALVAALREHRIAGAGIDVYADEPPPPDHPLFALENTILGSHNLAYSDELNRNANLGVARAIAALAAGAQPETLVNAPLSKQTNFPGT